MQKTLQFCITDDDKPTLPTVPSSLASTIEYLLHKHQTIIFMLQKVIKFDNEQLH